METSDVNVGPGSHHLFAACCLHCVLFLLPFFCRFCFNHFLTLNMEVEPYQFEPTVSEEESSASDDSSDVFLDDVNEDRIGHVGW